MTPSLIGTNADNELTGDDSVDCQRCSQHIKESIMMSDRKNPFKKFSIVDADKYSNKISRKKQRKVIEMMQTKIRKKMIFSPYSFCSNYVFTDDDIIKSWLPKHEKIKNSKFQKKTICV